jgi:hypothetical protein
MNNTRHQSSPRLPLQDKLKVLRRAAKAVADFTGVAWTETSWLRNSPGHVAGDSLDIMPDLGLVNGQPAFSGLAGSDPVLHLRPGLLNALMNLAFAKQPWLGPLSLLVGVENDHLHLQLIVPADASYAGLITLIPAGKVFRERYPNSATRHRQFIH